MSSVSIIQDTNSDSDYHVIEDNPSSSFSDVADPSDTEDFSASHNRKAKVNVTQQKQSSREMMSRTDSEGLSFIPIQCSKGSTTAQVLQISNVNRKYVEHHLENGIFLSLLAIPSNGSTTPKVVILRNYESKKGYFAVCSDLLQSVHENSDSTSALYLMNGKLKFSESQLFVVGLIVAKLPSESDCLSVSERHMLKKWFKNVDGRPSLPNEVFLDMGELVTKPSPRTNNRPLLVHVNPIFHSNLADWKPPEFGRYNSHYFDLHHIPTNLVSTISVQCSSVLKEISVRLDPNWAECEEAKLNALDNQHCQVFVVVKKGSDTKLHTVPELLSRCVCTLDYQYIESEDLKSFLCKIGVRSGDQVGVCTGKLSVNVGETEGNCYLTPVHFKRRYDDERPQNARTEDYITDLNQLQSLPSTGFESSAFAYSYYSIRRQRRTISVLELDVPPLSAPCFSLTSEPGEIHTPCNVQLTLRPVVLLDIPENFALENREDLKNKISACTWCGPPYLKRYHQPSFSSRLKIGLNDFGAHRYRRRELTFCFCEFRPPSCPPVQKVQHCRQQHGKLLLSGYIKCDLCSQVFGTRAMLAGHLKYHEKRKRGKDFKCFSLNRTYWEHGRLQLRKDINSFFKETEFTTDLNISSCEDWVLTKSVLESCVDLAIGSTDVEMGEMPEAMNRNLTDPEPSPSIPHAGNGTENNTTSGPSFQPVYLAPTCPELSGDEDDVGYNICGRTRLAPNHDQKYHGNLLLPSRWKCTKCEKQFATVDGFMVHTPCVGGQFKCMACPLKFKHYTQGLLLHYSSGHRASFISCYKYVGKHDQTDLGCEFCPRSFSSREDLDEHAVVHEVTLTGRPLVRGHHVCSVCQFVFANEKSRDFHESLHGGLQCPSCEEHFKDINSLQCHIPSCHVLRKIPDLTQRCCHCGVSKRGGFLTQTPLERGCEYKHELAKQCTLCSKKFKYQTQLARHLYEIHREVRKTYCQKCDVWFPTRYLLMVHRNAKCLKTGKSRYGCKCGVYFSRKDNLKSHQRKKRAIHLLQGKTTSSQTLGKKRIDKNQMNQESEHFSSCSRCYKLFSKRHQLRLHRRLAHKTTDSSCSACKLTFHSASVKRNHDRVYHGELLFRCHVCQFRVRSRIGLQRHITDMHYQYYKCIVCKVSFEFQHQHEQHMKLHENQCEKCLCLHGMDENCPQGQINRAAELCETPYEKWKRPLTPGTRSKFECLMCMQTFANRPQLACYESHWNQHVMEVSTITKCPYCYYTTVQGFADIRGHIMEFHPKNFHQCKKCLLHFTHSETLLFHQKYCHLTSVQQKTFIELSKNETFCEKCGVLFDDRVEMAKHQAEVHQNLKQGPYYCHLCDTGFKERRKLTRHDSHSRAYVCELCRFITRSSASMLTHLAKLHKLGQLQVFHCQDCPFKTEVKTSLEKHLIRKHKHRLEKDCPFLVICEKCGKQLHDTEKFNHNVLHEKNMDRKFVCEVCDAKFKLKHHLSNHMNIHQDKQYACKECDLKFTLRHHLESHQRSFHGRSGYKCRDCGEEFKLRWKRTKHRQCEHGASGFTDDEDLGSGSSGRPTMAGKRKRKHVDDNDQ